MRAELRNVCDAYLASCFNEHDRAQVQALVDANNETELESCMLPRISFGTSGLRGKMQAGFARINDLTIFQASLGLRDYVLQTVPDAKSRGIVIGFDHRHNSQRFAQIVEAVFAPVMNVFVFGTLVHTPLVPFSVKTLKAACGVMITASHNPKQDNGYKVYGENACAIIPPHDQGIANAIIAASEREATVKPEFGIEHASVKNVYEQVTKAYFSALFATIPVTEDTPNGRDFKFCYTPMHGVGLIYARVAMSSASGSGPKMEMVTVAEQALPDPDFPSVKFPNPEEQGALDLAIQTANTEGISLVVATDPDADRLGAAEKVDDSWRILTGNQIGVLLAHELIRRSDSTSKRALLSSAVSSKMLEAIGNKEGIYWEETLTGFKWLGNRALALHKDGYQVLLAYEEALGFMPYDIVYDKDGILSMTVLLALAKRLYSKGETLSSQLTKLYERYGYFSSANSYFIISDPKLLSQVMGTLRQPGYPETLSGRKVSRVRDLTQAFDSSTPDKRPTLPTSKESEMITFWFEPGKDDAFTSATMTIRGSGTEPKLKYYIEAQAASLEVATTAAKSIEKDLREIWFKDHTLQRPT